MPQGLLQLARSIHLPGTLMASLAVVVSFALLPIDKVPTGLLTSDQPLLAPLYVIEPIFAAVPLLRSCFSDSASLEATATRQVRSWHTALLATAVVVVGVALSLQPNVPSAARSTVALSYIGAVGLTLTGGALLGHTGWVVPIGYLLLLGTTGAKGFGEPAFWAWSLHPWEVMAPSAAGLAILGCCALATRWSRTSSWHEGVMGH